MILKYCFNNEIHKAFAHPLTFDALIDDIKMVFRNKMPDNFSLQYKDSEGDLITISSDLEYQSMLVFDLTRSMPSIKIFITPCEALQGKMKLVPLPLSDCVSQDSFEVVSESSNSNSIIEIGASSMSFSQDEDSMSYKTKPILPQQVLAKHEGDNQDMEPNSPMSERSNDSFNRSLARLEARAAALKRQLNMFVQEHELENVMGKENLESSTDEQSISGIEPLRSKIQNTSQMLPTQYCSLENSVLSKEIENAVEEIAAKQIQKVFRKIISSNQKNETPYGEGSDVLELKPTFWNQLDYKRREAKMAKNNAVLKIQNAFKRYKLRKNFRNLIERCSDIAGMKREDWIARTKEQVSLLIQRTIHSQFGERLDECNKSLDQLTNENIEAPSTPRRQWGFDGMEAKDYRDSIYESEDDGTIFSGVKPSGQDLEEDESDYYDDTYLSPRVKKDDYIKCRLNLSSGGNSLQSPSTAKINEAYRRVKALEENEIQDFYDYSVMDLGSPRIQLYDDNYGNKVVSRTICVENIGTKPWQLCYVRTIGDLKGKIVRLENVGIGEARLVTLEMTGDFKPGNYLSEWRLIHENENGVMEFIGCPFDLGFSIEHDHNEDYLQEKQQDKTEDYFYEEDEELEEDEEEFFSPKENEDQDNGCNNEEDEEEEEEDDEEEYDEEFEEDSEEDEQDEQEDEENQDSDGVFTRYLNYREELAKVREIRKIFPNDSLDDILEFVEMNNNLSTDELLMSYWAYRKAIQE